jgi:hypothetical protein
MVTARAKDLPGTKGLALFLIPRVLKGGETNGLYIRRFICVENTSLIFFTD